MESGGYRSSPLSNRQYVESSLVTVRKSGHILDELKHEIDEGSSSTAIIISTGLPSLVARSTLQGQRNLVTVTLGFKLVSHVKGGDHRTR